MRPPAPAGGLARDKLRAECALSAAPIRRTYRRRGRLSPVSYPQKCSHNIFSLASGWLGKHIDRGCYSYSKSVWPQLVELPPYLRWLKLRGSRFCFVFLAWGALSCRHFLLKSSTNYSNNQRIPRTCPISKQHRRA